MAQSAVFSVVKSIGKLKSSGAKFPQSIREQLGRIESLLVRLLAISKIADARQKEDDWIRGWIAKTREVVYDAGDLLDIFAVEVSLKNKPIFFRSPSKTKLNTWDDVESRIFSQEKNWQSYIIGSISQPENLSSFIRRNHSQHEVDFVGMEEDIKELVAQLVNEDASNCCRIVSIVGKAGIGKSALARKVFHHESIRSQFSAFAWAIISREWELEEVLKRIICKLVPGKREVIGRMRNVPDLIKELFEVQKSTKCLVFLDDVCGTDFWNSLRPAFLHQKSGSKVLLTTRDKDIAQHVDTDTTCYIYEQRRLNEEESWKLLRKKAFDGYEYVSRVDSGSFGSCKSDVEEDESDNLDTPCSDDVIEDTRIGNDALGREMVLECGGLPLAICLLGELTSKASFTEWEEVQQSFKSHLREIGIEDNGVYEMIAVNYHELPYQIKHCFWYLSNFPEYYSIPTWKLYQLWEAEGFILSENPGKEDESITDIADSYLCELKKRCMVQVQIEEWTSRLKYCKLHEFVREICIIKGNEENFRSKTLLPDESEPNLSPSYSISTWSSETSIPVDSHFETMFICEQGNTEHIRSALLYAKPRERKKLQYTLKQLCDSYKLLRVLDLEKVDLFEELSESISNLVHLRYLSFRDCIFTKLPSSIGNLKFLYTLDLRVAFKSKLIIPDMLQELNYLRHLYLPPEQNRSNKLHLSGLRNLETLKNFDPTVSKFKDIQTLKELRKLTAIFCFGIENVKAIINLRINPSRLSNSSFRIHCEFNSEKEFHLLEQLVGRVHLRKLDLVGHIEKLPEHNYFSQHLTKLTLRKSELKEDPFAILEKLPNLYTLTLRKNAYVGKRFCCSAQGFCKLRKLEFQGLDYLEDWIIEEGCMRNLIHLKIEECTRLQRLPEGIKFLRTIMEIQIANMPEAFKQTVESLQEAGGNNLCKITFTVTGQASKSGSRHQQGARYRGILETVTPSLVPREWQDP